MRRNVCKALSAMDSIIEATNSQLTCLEEMSDDLIKHKGFDYYGFHIVKINLQRDVDLMHKQLLLLKEMLKDEKK